MTFNLNDQTAYRRAALYIQRNEAAALRRIADMLDAASDDDIVIDNVQQSLQEHLATIIAAIDSERGRIIRLSAGRGGKARSGIHVGRNADIRRAYERRRAQGCDPSPWKTKEAIGRDFGLKPHQISRIVEKPPIDS